MADHDDPPAPEIQIRPLHTVQDAYDAAAVLTEVWRDTTVMPANMLRALSHSGNYTMGLYSGDRMVGASAAFFAEPWARTMHSHITGVLPEFQSQGLGRILKSHQREWALTRDVGHITWTFDPLIARNATFNLDILGARVTEYLPDHYGLPSGHGSEKFDRLMVSWAVAESPAQRPSDADVVASVAIPVDIEQLRDTDPVEAAMWQGRVRQEFSERFEEGLVVGGFHAPRGYLFVQDDPDART